MKYLTPQQAHTVLARAITEAGGCTLWAAKVGICPSYAYALARGARPITDEIASYLKLERRESFRRVK